jgi:hypothetical protein
VKNKEFALIIIGLVLMTIALGVMLYRQETAVNKCIVSEYESKRSSESIEEYCTAKYLTED